MFQSVTRYYGQRYEILPFRWRSGSTLFKFLKNVKIIPKEGGPPIEFNSDGSKKFVELKIMNLQPVGESEHYTKRWEEIGVWQTGIRHDVNKTQVADEAHQGND